MQSIRDAANAVMQMGRTKRRSIREMLSRSEVDYYCARTEFEGKASPSTLRKWRRTHEAREAGWIK